MFPTEGFLMDISEIDLVHEFVLDDVHRCAYPNGRGMYGVVHCVEGTAEYRFASDERLVIEKGDTLLLSPWAVYSIFTQKTFRHYTVNFLIHREHSRPSILDKPYCLLKNTNAEQFLIRLNKLNNAWKQKSMGYEMLSISHLYALLSLFYFEYKNKQIPSDAMLRLQPAKEYIEQNFNLPITLEDLAKHCNMSITNFRREWQRLHFMTPMQYRDEIKLSHAKEYLISGLYSVDEVAEKCGFESTGYFIVFFKKHVGITPNRFKKRSITL